MKEKKYKEIIEEIDIEIKNNLEELNKKIQELLDNIYSETDEINKQIVESINDFSDIIKYMNHQSFKEYFSIKVGAKGGDLTKEIIDEIKIATLSLDKIFEEKGFREWIKSLFSKINYFQNSLDIIINTFTNKMEYILVLLIEEFKRYIERTFHEIDSTCAVSTNIYTEVQQQFLKELKVEYEEKKYRILKFKNKLLNKDDS